MYNFWERQFVDNNHGASSNPETQFDSGEYDPAYNLTNQGLRGGSFADIGAAFGFDPDLPMQISSQNMPQPHLSYSGHSQSFNPPNVDVNMETDPSSLFAPLSLGNLSPSQPYEGGYEQGGWQNRGLNPTTDSRKEKRQRRNLEDEEAHRPRIARLPGACIRCRTLKVKCEFIEGQDTCNRCRTGKKECVVLEKKPRRLPPKREELLNKIREQECTINELKARLEAAHIAPFSQSTLTSTGNRQSKASSSSPPYSRPIQSNTRTAKNALLEMPVEATEGFKGWKHDHWVNQRPTAGADLGAQDESEGEYDDAPGSAGKASGGEGDRERERTKIPAVGTSLPPIRTTDWPASRTQPESGEGGRNTTVTSTNEADQEDLGVPNSSYFMLGISSNPEIRSPARESQFPPRILASSLVSPREVDKLFEIFFDQINLSVSLLDPVIYTPQTTYWRSPFLFTVICAIASRYLTERVGLYPVLMNFAKVEAGEALVAGLKSPELVAGYVLLSLYPVPWTRREENRGSLMVEIAVEMATELKLHRSTTAQITNARQAREVASRTRIWINCYNIQRSTSMYFGKPFGIQEDHAIREFKFLYQKTGHSRFWYQQTGFSYDIHLTAYTQLLRVMARFHKAIYSDSDASAWLNKAVDFESVTRKYETEILDHWAEWDLRFHEEPDYSSIHCLYRIELSRLGNAYSRLVILSFRLQNALQMGLPVRKYVLKRCLETASFVVKIVVENMAPHHFLRAAPDAQFVFPSSASVFLLKLIHPRFALDLEEHREEIVTLITRLIDVFQSDKVAVDDFHTPKLYARFLARLLEENTSPSSKPSPSSAQQLSEIEERNSEHPTMKKQRTQSSPQFSPPPVPHEGNLREDAPLNPNSDYQPFNVSPSSFQNAPNRLGGYANIQGASSESATIPAHFRAGSGPSITDNIVSNDLQTYEDNEMLATMTSPTFWEDMMLPGYSWTPLEAQPESLQ